MNKQIGVAFVALITLAGCSGNADEATVESNQEFIVNGSVSVPAEAWKGKEASQMTKPGDPCFFGTDGNPYPDVDTGAQVTLRDSSGATVGLARLQSGGHLFGWMEGLPTIFSHTEDWVEDYCVFDFVISGVESEDSFFSIEVANRGEVSYSRDDLSSPVSLSLGG